MGLVASIEGPQAGSVLGYLILRAVSGSGLDVGNFTPSEYDL